MTVFEKKIEKKKEQRSQALDQVASVQGLYDEAVADTLENQGFFQSFRKYAELYLDEVVLSVGGEYVKIDRTALEQMCSISGDGEHGYFPYGEGDESTGGGGSGSVVETGKVRLFDMDDLEFLQAKLDDEHFEVLAGLIRLKAGVVAEWKRVYQAHTPEFIAEPSITLEQEPVFALVYSAGLLLEAGTDYVISGNVISFSIDYPLLEDGRGIQVIYY